jgi:hypothetical protein
MRLISEDLFKLKFIVLKQVETQVAIFVYVIIRDAFVVLAADALLLLERGSGGDQQSKERTNSRSALLTQICGNERGGGGELLSHG